jgi:hypothetical protein
MRRIEASFKTGPTMIGLAYLGLTYSAAWLRGQMGKRKAPAFDRG